MVLGATEMLWMCYRVSGNYRGAMGALQNCCSWSYRQSSELQRGNRGAARVLGAMECHRQSHRCPASYRCSWEVEGAMGMFHAVLRIIGVLLGCFQRGVYRLSWEKQGGYGLDCHSSYTWDILVLLLVFGTLGVFGSSR